MLTAYTTHIKTGYMRRNGAASSDQATITTTFFRHGDMLTLALVMEDPNYLTEPYILTRSYMLSANSCRRRGPAVPRRLRGRRGRPRPALPSRQESVRRRDGQDLSHPGNRRDGRSGNHVSGISREDQGQVHDAAAVQAELRRARPKLTSLVGQAFGPVQMDLRSTSNHENPRGAGPQACRRAPARRGVSGHLGWFFNGAAVLPHGAELYQPGGTGDLVAGDFRSPITNAIARPRPVRNAPQ